MTDPTSWSLTELRRRIDSGTASAGDVVAAHRDRACAVGPGLNAFTELTDEGVGAEGPLHGLPIAVKDAFVDGGRVPTMGSKVHPTWLSGTAEVLRRLRAAGATVIGYTNLHEWAIGTTSVVTATGPVRNPWDRSRMSGGSSGGSAAAVAAGLVPAAIGTDAAGSIRIPAAACGVVGVKATFGGIPLDGEAGAASPLNAAGVIARSVDDAAFLFSVLTRRRAEPVDVSGLRLGIPSHCFYDDVEPRVAEVVRGAAEQLGRSVAKLQSVHVRGVESSASVVARTQLPLVAGRLRDRLEARPGDFDPATAKALQRGLRTEMGTEPDRADVRAAWDEAFSVVDVLVVPTLPALPPPIDQRKVDLPRGTRSVDLAQIELNAPMNVAGLPAMSVPCGVLDGLPVALTLVAPAGAEDVLFAVGTALEDRLDRAFRDRVAPNDGTDD